jgi:sarcosine oxidase subunit gamma
MLSELQDLLAGSAAVISQTDGRRLIQMHGARVRETLCKGFSIDLHPAVFRENDTAMTVVNGMDVQVALVDARPAFDIIVYRSFAQSFWTWLEASAAEFGLEAVNEGAAASRVN